MHATAWTGLTTLRCVEEVRTTGRISHDSTYMTRPEGQRRMETGSMLVDAKEWGGEQLDLGMAGSG